ncbi:MAG: hypothetical protein AABX73_03875 [Nanoarchaeota archaeon]
MKDEILRRNAVEYFQSAEEALKKDRCNTAVVLFFKSLVSFIDLLLFQKTNISPSSHTDRFRETQKQFPEIYDILDRDFPFYQDSYIQTMTKELAEVIKDDARFVAEKTGTKI